MQIGGENSVQLLHSFLNDDLGCTSLVSVYAGIETWTGKTWKSMINVSHVNLLISQVIFVSAKQLKQPDKSKQALKQVIELDILLQNMNVTAQ